MDEIFLLINDKLILSNKLLEKKKDELQMLLDTIPLQVWYLTDLKTYGFVNNNYASFFGKNKDEFENKSIYNLFDSDTADLFIDKNLEIIKTKKTILTEEIRKDYNNEEHLLSIIKTPKLDKYGNIEYIVCIAEDITKKRILEQQLLQSQKMEAIGKLASGIAHDFNNVLTVIIGYSEMILAQQNIDSELFNKVEQIKFASERAANLTKQLLAYSRKQILKEEIIDINSVFMNMQQMLFPLIGENIKLKILFDRNIGYFKGDKGQIEQVFMNLIVNAKDAMPNGGELLIKTQQIVENENFIAVSVEDTGFGIEEKVLNKIFEPFFTTKDSGKGTGLGLSVVYGIVTQHKGKISVESKINTGTKFKILFPKYEGNLEPINILNTEKQYNSTHKKCSILIVEDDLTILKFTTTILLKEGYTVFTAKNKEDVIQLFENETKPIDFVFTDMILPDCSGIEIAKYCLSKNPDINVLFTSGYDFEKQKIDFDLKKYDFLPKPYKINELLQKIKEI